jgi:signal transduction histidine kinase
MLKLTDLTEKLRRARISLSFKFLSGTAIVLALTMSISFYFLTNNHEAMIFKQLNNQARSLFKHIVLTEKWIFDHKDVYVLSQSEINRTYLTEKEQRAVEDKIYIDHNPATIIKGLSEYAEKAGLYWFRTTSLKLKNQENKPDDFERAALISFEGGLIKESSKTDKIGPNYYFRYIAPLYIEQSCLECHASQGYKKGDVRGALSIGIPMDFSFSMIKNEERELMLTLIATIIILMLILYLLTKKLVLSPVNKLNSYVKGFSVERKADIPLISTGDELEDLSRSFVIMSKSLNKYHTHLEDMVHAATKDLENTNERLIAMNERKSDFVAKVSHELRTPLTSIKGAMDYLSAKFSMHSGNNYDTNELITFFNVIKNNSERLVRMVNDTLDLERIESGSFDIHFTNFDILNVTKDVITGFQSITSKKKITFGLVSETETMIFADEDRIRQVMINLISNAIKVSPQESEIQISISGSDKEVTVSVKDPGHGIPAEEHEKVFDKFYTRGTKDGSGLGLSICKGIIEAHNGGIYVSDKYNESGCTLTFTLPKTGKDI